MAAIVFKGKLYKARDWQEFNGYDWIRWGRHCDALSRAETAPEFERAIRGIVELQCPDGGLEDLSAFSRLEQFEFVMSSVPDYLAMIRAIKTSVAWTHRVPRKAFRTRLEAWVKRQALTEVSAINDR